MGEALGSAGQGDSRSGCLEQSKRGAAAPRGLAVRSILPLVTAVIYPESGSHRAPEGSGVICRASVSSRLVVLPPPFRAEAPLGLSTGPRRQSWGPSFCSAVGRRPGNRGDLGLRPPGPQNLTSGRQQDGCP